MFRRILFFSVFGVTFLFLGCENNGRWKKVVDFPIGANLIDQEFMKITPGVGRNSLSQRESYNFIFWEKDSSELLILGAPWPQGWSFLDLSTDEEKFSSPKIVDIKKTPVMFLTMTSDKHRHGWGSGFYLELINRNGDQLVKKIINNNVLKIPIFISSKEPKTIRHDLSKMIIEGLYNYEVSRIAISDPHGIILISHLSFAPAEK